MELLSFPPGDEQIVHLWCALLSKKAPRPRWNEGIDAMFCTTLIRRAVWQY